MTYTEIRQIAKAFAETHKNISILQKTDKFAAWDELRQRISLMLPDKKRHEFLSIITNTVLERPTQ